MGTGIRSGSAYGPVLNTSSRKPRKWKAYSRRNKAGLLGVSSEMAVTCCGGNRNIDLYEGWCYALVSVS